MALRLWIEGGLDNAGKTGSFNAMDNLLADMKRRWPSLQTITVAGFSAGAQFVQHYVGFAHPPERGAAALCGGRSRQLALF